MGLFKEINCAYCGKKTSLLSRMKLRDGNYICGECASKIPLYMRDSVRNNYGREEYKELLAYIEYSKTVLYPQFHETHSYYSIHIDTENKLFCFGYGVNENTLIFSFQDLDDFNLVFRGEEYKEGLLGDKVKGELLMTVKVSYPYFYHEEILDRSAKAKAKKKFLSSTIEYDNPAGMDEFLLYFQTAWQASIGEPFSQAPSEPSIPNDLQQAMALFMIDRVEDLSIDKIKEQRNRLIKAFHPDKNSADDTAYAQKINGAYDILLQYLNQ